jgi:hypothetical protein
MWRDGAGPPHLDVCDRFTAGNISIARPGSCGELGRLSSVSGDACVGLQTQTMDSRTGSARIPRTEAKLREAQFFLEQLASIQGQSIRRKDPEHFAFYLSAFLSAARSVTLALQNDVGHEIYDPGSNAGASV